jgi:hypothetical protein
VLLVKTGIVNKRSRAKSRVTRCNVKTGIVNKRSRARSLQRVTLDLARDLLLTMPVLTIQRVTLDLARHLLLTMHVLTLQRVTVDQEITGEIKSNTLNC